MHFVRKIFYNLLPLCLLFVTPTSWAKSHINMPRGVTPISHDIFDLHMIILWICVAIGVIVFAVLLYSLIFHRKSKGHKAADFNENKILEIVWAIIPFFILAAMAIPATIVLMRMDDTSDATNSPHQ